MSEPMLAIDAGNTRVKWGVRAGGGWLATGAAAVADHGSLRAQLQGVGAQASVAVVSNVAGAATADGIADVLSGLGFLLHWFAASPVCGGVVNRYDEPQQLGPDRWAALIGARSRFEGACVVANCGTATTIDALTPDGEFIGGVIAAGVDLMRDALMQRVPALRGAPGRFALFPRNTADAIASGAVYAAAGAIVGVRRRLEEWTGATPRIVLTGGAAGHVVPQLIGQVDVVEHLVLEGLAAAMAGA